MAIGLAVLLTTIVKRYSPARLESVAQANRYWPASWKSSYVHWLYLSFAYESLFIGLIGGLLRYWKGQDILRRRSPRNQIAGF